MFYDESTIDEKQAYKEECNKAIERAECLKRLLNNNDFTSVFDVEYFKEDSARLCSLFAVHGVNKDDIVKQLTFYAMFDKFMDDVLKIGELATSNLEAANEVDRQSKIME